MTKDQANEVIRMLSVTIMDEGSVTIEAGTPESRALLMAWEKTEDPCVKNTE